MSEDNEPADARHDGEHYDAIRDAVMETARGRWFLAEFARRNRSTDTQAVMEALSRLEGMVERQGEKADQQRIRTDLLDMIAVIARARAEIAAMRPDRDGSSSLSAATTELQLIVGTTEQATSDILAAAEKIQDQAWKIRAAGVDPAVCDALDAGIADIYTGCSFQDLTGQRIDRIVRTVEYLETRLNAMMTLWADENSAPSMPPVRWAERSDAHLLNGPAAQGEGIEQAEVDELFGMPAAGSNGPREATREPGPEQHSILGDTGLFDIEAINPRLRVHEPDGTEPDVFEAADAAPPSDDEASPCDPMESAIREAGLDLDWERAETTAGPAATGRRPVPDVDLSALTREQKLVLFS